MNYKPRPNSKNMPSRKSRKSERSRVFLDNKKMAREAKKALQSAS